MRLSKRDRAIIDDLTRFRCLSRDDIAAIHFPSVKDPIKAANSTLLRLYRQGLVDRSANYEPFVYFPVESNMKKSSQKIPHFLKIAGVYRELLVYDKPKLFHVEAKYAKGLAEPDVFTIFKNSPLFIEVQRSVYNQTQINEKIERYEALYHSRLLDQETWQRPGHPVFPAVLILTDTRYAVNSASFPIMQASSISDFMKQMGAKRVIEKSSTQAVITIKNNKGA